MLGRAQLCLCGARVQQLQPVKDGLGAMAAGVGLQGDLLVSLVDKSLPTALGLAGMALNLQPIAVPAAPWVLHSFPLTSLCQP